MAFVIDIISWILMSTGSVMLVIGSIGIVRLPDVFSRMHAAGIIDTMGAGAILLGLMLQGGLTITTVKLGLIIIFIMFTSPTATHALARACLHGGVDPQLEGEAPKIFSHVKGSNSSKT
jgi:multicomponent Na+:H+ antiporter subunit G|tara:strand:- start:246 stop:602 length:357 start_codon:yes stop_codon:yes gene_type:complete